MKIFAFHPKVTAGVFASYIVVIAMVEAARRGIDISAIEGAAIDGVLTTLFGYVMPSGDSDGLTVDQVNSILSNFKGVSHA